MHSERDGAKVRQRTLLNLGSDFDLPNEAWPELCRRIDEILNGQAPLIDGTPAAVEKEAQRIAAQLLARGRAGDAEAVRDPVRVDAASLELTRPPSVGVEQVLARRRGPAVATSPRKRDERGLLRKHGKGVRLSIGAFDPRNAPPRH